MKRKEKNIEASKRKITNKDTRSKLREQAFQIFFADEFDKFNKNKLDLFYKENNLTSKSKIKYIEQLINLKQEKEEELEEYIKKYLDKSWNISRLTKAKLAILKLTILELKYNNLPYRVAINEAVELAKSYEDEKASKFINGFLASFVKDNVLNVEGEIV